MAMSVGGSSMGIWKALSDANLRMYQYNMERGRILLQGAAAQESERELRRIETVYNDTKERTFEAEINAAYEKKTALADTSARLTNALKGIENVRMALYEMASAAISGKSELFDEKLRGLNDQVGSSTGLAENLQNLIGNRSRGSWTSSTEMVTANGMDISFKSQFLGTDYKIILDDGQTLSLEADKGSVVGSAGEYKFSTLTMALITDPQNGNNLVNGSKIEFEHNGTLMSGTIKMGGLKIGSSWMYGLKDTSEQSHTINILEKEIAELKKDETTNAIRLQEATVELDEARNQRTATETGNKVGGAVLATIVRDAVKALDKVTREYEFANSMVTSSMNSYDATMQDLQRKYDDAATETLNARKAAREALNARMKLADTKFALSSTTSSVLISGLFSYTNASTEKKSLFDVLKVDQYAALKNLMGR